MVFRSSRQKLLDECLHRHVTSTIDLTEDEQTLVAQYNLPLNEILAKKAQRAEYDKQWMNAVHLWIDAKQWRRAHDTYCTYVFHETLLKGNSFSPSPSYLSHWRVRLSLSSIRRLSECQRQVGFIGSSACNDCTLESSWWFCPTVHRITAHVREGATWAGEWRSHSRSELNDRDTSQLSSI